MGDLISLKRSKSGSLLCKRPGCKTVINPAHDREAREQGILARRNGYCRNCADDAELDRIRYEKAMKGGK